MADLVKLSQRLNRLHARQAVLLGYLRGVTLSTSLESIRTWKNEFERNADKIAALERRLK